MTDSLLAAVLATPEDAELRHVWADALLERGDPRGEVIALNLAALAGSLTKAQEARVASILAKYARSWLGAIDGVVMSKAGLTFDRGLLHSCQIQVKTLALLDRAIGDPGWQAVEQVWFCDRFAWDARVVPLLVHPVMRSLRTVVGIGANGVFAALADGPRELPFETVWVVDDGWRSSEGEGFAACEGGALPALRHFGYETTSAGRLGVLARPFVGRLESFGWAGPDPAAECIAWAERIPTLARLELRFDSFLQHGSYRTYTRLRFDREGARFERLEIALGGSRAPFAPSLALPHALPPRRLPTPQTLARLLLDVPADPIRTVRVALPETSAIRDVVSQRFPRATITFTPD